MIPVTDIAWFVTLNYWTHKYWFNLAYGQLQSLTASCQDGIDTSSIIFLCPVCCVPQVHSISYGVDQMCMFCTKDAKDKKMNKKVQKCDKTPFPCLKVMVKFSISGNEHTSLMHPDSIQARGAYSKVSLFYLLYGLHSSKKFLLAFSYEADRRTEKDF